MAKLVPMPLNDANALKLLREIAADSSRVVVLKHAAARMAKRHITLPMVLDCLRGGSVEEPPALDQHGNWKLTVWRRVAGKDLRVAAAIDLPHRVVVITVY